MFRLNSRATGSLTCERISMNSQENLTKITPVVVHWSFLLTYSTCWNLISRSNVIGSLGLQMGGTVCSRCWAAVHGISFTMYVPE